MTKNPQCRVAQCTAAQCNPYSTSEALHHYAIALAQPAIAIKVSPAGTALITTAAGVPATALIASSHRCRWPRHLRLPLRLRRRQVRCRCRLHRCNPHRCLRHGPPLRDASIPSLWRAFTRLGSTATDAVHANQKTCQRPNRFHIRARKADSPRRMTDEPPIRSQTELKSRRLLPIHNEERFEEASLLLINESPPRKLCIKLQQAAKIIDMELCGPAP